MSVVYNSNGALMSVVYNSNGALSECSIQQ